MKTPLYFLLICIYYIITFLIGNARNTMGNPELHNIMLVLLLGVAGIAWGLRDFALETSGKGRSSLVLVPHVIGFFSNLRLLLILLIEGLV